MHSAHRYNLLICLQLTCRRSPDVLFSHTVFATMLRDEAASFYTINNVYRKKHVHNW